MTDEQLMQQALDALNCGWSSGETDVLCRAKAIMALRERLAQLASGQKPVAQWQRRHPIKTNGHWENTDEHDAKWFRDNAMAWDVRVLYPHSAPAQQPLSEAQIHNADPLPHVMFNSHRIEFARAIEALHGIKAVKP